MCGEVRVVCVYLLSVCLGWVCGVCVCGLGMCVCCVVCVVYVVQVEISTQIILKLDNV